MPEIIEEAVREMARARDAATAAAEYLFERKRQARDEGDFGAFNRYSLAYRSALEAEEKATNRLIAGLTNASASKVRKLSDATDELNQRLARLRQSEAAFSDVAAGLTMLTHAILLFGLV